MKYLLYLLVMVPSVCVAQHKLSRRYMDNAIRYEWRVDTARLTVNLVEPATPQLRTILEDYVRELKAYPDLDVRLKPKIYVAMDVQNQDTTMRIYMDHSVSMHGLESYTTDTSQSPFCGVFIFDGMDVSILRSNLEEPCFTSLYNDLNSSRSLDYAYDFSIKNGRVRMINNFPWSYTKRYLMRGGEFVLIEKKYVPTYKSNVSEGHLAH